MGGTGGEERGGGGGGGGGGLAGRQRKVEASEGCKF